MLAVTATDTCPDVRSISVFFLTFQMQGSGRVRPLSTSKWIEAAKMVDQKLCPQKLWI